jgi:uncharacterized protein (TIGR02284 family)
MSNRLNDLLTRNYDAELGYKKAAKIVQNPQLKRFFETQAQNRFDFGHELNSEISNVGGVPSKETHHLGDAHRAWMCIKDTFTYKDEESILGEVIKGEKIAVDEYKDVLNNSTLPPSTKIILIHQVDNIENALKSSKNFEVVFA